MASLVGRIINKLKLTLNSYLKDCKFSMKLANYRCIDDISYRFQLSTVSKKYHKKKDDFILMYLKEELHNVIQDYRNDSYVGEFIDNAPIWVCWWDGEENAPKLVQQCIKSIRKNAGNHPVYLITKDDYSKYLTIPNFILEKVESGSMCIAHFSDYLRISLIEKYGGLWLDSTIYCSKLIPNNCFDLPIYTCKSLPIDSRYISKFRWTTFCLGGWKGNVFYRFLKAGLEEYWKNEENSIDYLFFDYLIEIANQEFTTVKECFKKIPCNNPHRDDLQAAMNSAVSYTEFSNIIKDDTSLYKLSWRESYSTKSIDGKESIYGFFINQ